MIIEFLPREEKQVTFLIPYDKSSIISQLHQKCIVQDTEYMDEGTKVTVIASQIIIEQYENYIIK